MSENYMRIEDLKVYMILCKLHIEICELTDDWPFEEKYELVSQICRSSNSSPSELAENDSDRHIRNKIEGVNQSRGEANETIHHLFMAKLKGYLNDTSYKSYRDRYRECIRMLNGIERTLEQHLPEKDRRWQ